MYCTLLRKRRGRCSEESGRSYIEHRERGRLYKCSVTVSALATGPSVLCNPGTVQMRGCEDARMRGCEDARMQVVWRDDRCSGERVGRRRELGPEQKRRPDRGTCRGDSLLQLPLLELKGCSE